MPVSAEDLGFVVSNTRARIVNLEMLTLNKDLFALDGNRRDVSSELITSFQITRRAPVFGMFQAGLCP